MENMALPIFFGFLGLIVGSFLNVIIYRVPNGLSIVWPRSHCPGCGQVLKPLELIPVISFLLLRGKCRKCQIPLSWRYPSVEILTGVLFILVFFFRSERTPIGILFDFLFIALLLSLSFIDMDYLRLPNVLVGIVALVGLANALVPGKPNLIYSLVGALSAGAFFLLIHFLYPEGMGFGDVKLVAAMGLYLGVKAVFASIFIASFIGLIIEGIKVLTTQKSLRQPIPFGPYLAAGGLILLFFEEYLINFFKRFVW